MLGTPPKSSHRAERSANEDLELQGNEKEQLEAKAQHSLTDQAAIVQIDQQAFIPEKWSSEDWLRNISDPEGVSGRVTVGEGDVQKATSEGPDLGVIRGNEVRCSWVTTVRGRGGKHTLIGTRVDQKVFPGVPLEDGDG